MGDKRSDGLPNDSGEVSSLKELDIVQVLEPPYHINYAMKYANALPCCDQIKLNKTLFFIFYPCFQKVLRKICDTSY